MSLTTAQLAQSDTDSGMMICCCPACLGDLIAGEELLIGSTAPAADTQEEIAYTNTTGKPSYDADEAAQILTRWNDKWGSDALGSSGGTVTFSFLPGGEDIQEAGYPDNEFSELSQSQIDLVLESVARINEVADINLVWADEGTGTTYSTNGQIQIKTWDSGGGWSRHYTYYDGQETDEIYTSTITLGAGRVYDHIIHEIGHSLGLAHPGYYNGSGYNYNDDAVFFEDTDMYTVMSYWDEYYNGGNLGTPQTPMMYDIAALQRLYGANEDTNSGDTVYGFNSNTGRDLWTLNSASDTFSATIWDTGGTDTIDLSGLDASSPAALDLRQESFSSFGGYTYNLAIARGVEIENAIGGAGDDEIQGNELANRIEGNNGNDRLYGGAGDDTLLGGSDSDWLKGDQGDDTLDGGSGTSDVAAFASSIENYAISYDEDADSYTVTQTGGSLYDGTDTLTNIVVADFNDRLYNLRVDDGYGWNGAANAAYDLSAYEDMFLSDIEGQGFLREYETFYGVAHDEDWFSLTLDEASDLSLSFSYSNDDSGFYLELFDDAMNSLGGGDAGALEFTGLAAGTYYLEASLSTEEEGTDFDLSWSAESGTVTPPTPGGDDVFFEGFETDGNGTRYTVTETFSDGYDDYYARTDGDGLKLRYGDYTGFEGDYFWGVDDTDSGSNGDDLQVMTFTDIDISGFSDLVVSGLFARGDDGAPDSRYDTDDFLAVLYQIDGGGWNVGLLFRSEASSNAPLSLVTDLDLKSGVTAEQLADEIRDVDGNGDAKIKNFLDGYGDSSQRLSTSLEEFGFAIEEGSSLDLIIATHMDGGGEQVAYDAIKVSGGGTGPVDEETVLNTNSGERFVTIAAAVAAASAGDLIEVESDYAQGPESVAVAVDNLTVDLPSGISTPSFTLAAGLTFTATGDGDADITGAAGNETLIGNDGANTLSGGDASDILEGKGGDDTLLGGEGFDIAYFSGAIDDYDLSWDAASELMTVDHSRGSQVDDTDTLSSIERAEFADGTYRLIIRDNWGWNGTQSAAFDITAYEGEAISTINGNGEAYMYLGTDSTGLVYDDDWWSFTLDDMSDISFAFSYTNDEGGPGASLYDASGTKIDWTSYTDTDPDADDGYYDNLVTYDGLAAGTYFLRLRPWTEDEGTYYDFTWTIESDPVTEAKVLNLTQGTEFASIEDAVAAAVAGDSLAVQPAYDLASESVTVTVDRLTIDLPAGINAPVFDVESNLTFTLTGAGDADIFGTTGYEWVVGNDGRNVFSGGQGNDTFQGNGGDDEFAGIEGSEDRALFNGTLSEYDFHVEGDAPDEVTVTHARGSQSDGSDLLDDVEIASFTDRSVWLTQNDAYGLNLNTDLAFDLSAYEGTPLSSIDGLAVASKVPGDYDPVYDIDVFRMDTSEVGDLSVVIEPQDEDINLRVIILDADDNEVASDVVSMRDGVVTPAAVSYADAPAGTYYVSIRATSDTGSTPYDLTWSLETGPVSEALVLNLTQGTEFDTIEAAVAAAAAGDSLQVLPAYDLPSEIVEVTANNLTIDLPAGINAPDFELADGLTLTLTGNGDGDITGGLGDETVIGNDGANYFSGDRGDDRFEGKGGNDEFGGVEGDGDTAIFSGALADYDFRVEPDAPDEITVTHARGTGADDVDFLKNVEIAEFSDRAIYLDRNDAYGVNFNTDLAFDLSAYEGTALSAIDGLATAAKDPTDFETVYDIDVYRMDTAEDGDLSVAVDPKDVDINLRVILMDADGNEVASELVSRDADGNVSPEAVTFADAPAGTYYVSVRATSDTSATDYDLTWDLDTGTTPPNPGGVLFYEGFETEGFGSRYTGREVFSDGYDDYFDRTTGDGLKLTDGDYTGFEGSYFFGIEDTDSGSTGRDVQYISFDGIDISGASNIQFSGLFGRGETGAPGSTYDEDDYLAVLYRVDGGEYQTGLLFRSEGSSNTPLSLVTDLQLDSGVSASDLADELRDADGNGDAKVKYFTDSLGDASQRLSLDMESFGFAIESGSTLDIVIAAHLDGGYERAAFDAITVTGDSGTSDAFVFYDDLAPEASDLAASDFYADAISGIAGTLEQLDGLVTEEPTVYEEASLVDATDHLIFG
ncbi:MAG: M10 family metallopeptidase C-terminal domain-containing protein [Neomegalonema sp.]|nr:M10 family metallopeptidase C-terminal domain-containing protein [Neomegalonema sp.]